MTAWMPWGGGLASDERVARCRLHLATRLPLARFPAQIGALSDGKRGQGAGFAAAEPGVSSLK